ENSNGCSSTSNVVAISQCGGGGGGGSVCAGGPGEPDISGVFTMNSCGEINLDVTVTPQGGTITSLGWEVPTGTVNNQTSTNLNMTMHAAGNYTFTYVANYTDL